MMVVSNEVVVVVVIFLVVCDAVALFTALTGVKKVDNPKKGSVFALFLFSGLLFLLLSNKLLVKVPAIDHCDENIAWLALDSKNLDSYVAYPWAERRDSSEYTVVLENEDLAGNYVLRGSTVVLRAVPKNDDRN